MLMTAQQLCQMLDGDLEGNPDVTVSKPSKIEEAGPGSLSFLANPKYEHFVYETEASILLVARSFKPTKPVRSTLIRVDDVYKSLGVLLSQVQTFEAIDKGISELAFIHPEAQVNDDVSIGAFTYVGKGAKIEKGVVLHPHVFVGEKAEVNEDSILYSGVKIYRHCIVGKRCVIHANAVIGSDGFGFSRSENGAFTKIAQVGNVVIEDSVEIGANTVIDRATMGSTVIREGAKLDNLIQIAHNVEVGENSAIAAQSGVAGSTKLGKNVMIGGQAGFVGHITIADGVQVQAQSGVNASINEPGERVYGSPAIKYIDYLKSYSLFKQLPDLEKRISQLEKAAKQNTDSRE